MESPMESPTKTPPLTARRRELVQWVLEVIERLHTTYRFRKCIHGQEPWRCLECVLANGVGVLAPEKPARRGKCKRFDN